LLQRSSINKLGYIPGTVEQPFHSDLISFYLNVHKKSFSIVRVEARKAGDEKQKSPPPVKAKGLSILVKLHV
jgi:hypothetical protein